MKKLEFYKNGINLVFNIDDENRLLFEYIGTEKSYTHCSNHLFVPVEIKTTGSNQNDHHGAKRSGGSSGDFLFYKSHKESENALVFCLENKFVEVTLNYEFFGNIKVLRSFSTVKNKTSEPIGVEYISAFCAYGLDFKRVLIPHNGWVNELNWQEYTPEQVGLKSIKSSPIKRLNIHNTGTWSTKEYLPMGAVLGTTDTVLWQIEHNGSWSWEIGESNDAVYLKLAGPNEQENGWWKELAPAEVYKTPTAAVCVTNGDFNDALENITSYRRIIANKNSADSYLPVIFNDYMNCVCADPTTEKELPVIEAAAKLGAEIYCMDAGWYASGYWWDTVGEWKPYESRFPNGMGEVFEAVRKNGMIPGIWLEPETMGINCELAKNLSDDCFFCRHSKRVIDNGRYQLDFRNEKVVKYMNNVVDRLINDYKIGYFKFDYNIDAGAGTEVNSDSFGEGLEQCNAAYLDWVNGIYKRHPDLIIENCASGGMRMDYKTLQHFSVQSLTDNGSNEALSQISAMSATAVIPEQAAVWCIPIANSSTDTLALNMVNSMFKRVHLSGEITKLNDEQFKVIKDAVEYYKSIRSKIKSLKPFLPMGFTHLGDDISACGYSDDEKMYICVSRTGDTSSATLKLPKSAKSARVVYPLNLTAEMNLKDDELTVILPPSSGAVIELV